MVRTPSTNSRSGLLANNNRQNEPTNPSPQSPDSIYADLLASMGGGDLATRGSTPPAITATASDAQGSGLDGESLRGSQTTHLLDLSESGLSSDPEYEEDESDVWSPDGGYGGKESDHGDHLEDDEGFEDGEDFEDDEDFDDGEDMDDDQGSEKNHQEGERQATSQHTTSNRHPHAPLQSKLSLRIEEQRRRGIEVDSNGVRKGKIQCTNLGLHYQLDGRLVPAVFHADIRRKLLHRMDSLGSYDDEPVKGTDELDRTAFKHGQEHWVLGDRTRRPEVLTYWEKPDNAPDHRPKLVSILSTIQSPIGYANTTQWYDNRRLVLDTECRPVKLYHELPLTISGQCEGSRMEAWRRLNSDITMNDIKARMGWTTSKGKGVVHKPIKTSALANRMSRDRCRMGLKAWTQKEGSSIKEYRLLQTIPEAIQRAIVQTNSTSCYRDLTDAEMYYIEQGNKGTAASFAKAGHRRLDPQTREKNQEKKQTAKAKKMIELGSITIHEVVEEALSKPNKQTVRQNQSTSGSAAPALESPHISGKRDRDHEEHNTSNITAQDSQSDQEQPYSLEGEAPPKRPRFSPAEIWEQLPSLP
ncbi:MAG: hypothetical protein Q9209_002976 [Squamulea sp. 1 TL-2023]